MFLLQDIVEKDPSREAREASWWIQWGRSQWSQQSISCQAGTGEASQPICSEERARQAEAAQWEANHAPVSLQTQETFSCP